MVFTFAGADERQVGIAVVVGVFEGEAFVDVVGGAVVEALVGAIAEVPAEVSLEYPNVCAGAAHAVTEHGGVHVFGGVAQGHGELSGVVRQVEATAVDGVLTQSGNGFIRYEVGGETLPAQGETYAVNHNPENGHGGGVEGSYFRRTNEHGVGLSGKPLGSSLFVVVGQSFGGIGQQHEANLGFNEGDGNFGGDAFRHVAIGISDFHGVEEFLVHGLTLEGEGGGIGGEHGGVTAVAAYPYGLDVALG